MKNSADLTLLDLQNSSYPSQPHSVIAKYPVYGIILEGQCIYRVKLHMSLGKISKLE